MKSQAMETLLFNLAAWPLLRKAAEADNARHQTAISNYNIDFEKHAA
jgi:hypothetical protein